MVCSSVLVGCHTRVLIVRYCNEELWFTSFDVDICFLQLFQILNRARVFILDNFHHNVCQEVCIENFNIHNYRYHSMNSCPVLARSFGNGECWVTPRITERFFGFRMVIFNTILLHQSERLGCIGDRGGSKAYTWCDRSCDFGMI